MSCRGGAESNGTSRERAGSDVDVLIARFPVPPTGILPPMRRTVSGVLGVASAAGLWGSSGCAIDAFTPDFASASPGSRTAAVEATMRRYRPNLDAPFTPPYDDPRFREDLQWLVVLLQSDDPAVRFVSIEALASLVGERRGYDASDPLPERAVAIEAWTTWLYEQRIATASPLPPIGLLPPPQ
ncbi:MAG: hypothetical protein RLZZ565_1455 [Planctomycetota bacterium]